MKRKPKIAWSQSPEGLAAYETAKREAQAAADTDLSKCQPGHGPCA